VGKGDGGGAGEGAGETRPWGRAIAWLLFLGPFFFATYGLATWVTGLREEVPVVVFGWERHIPFLPWTIVPYWAIDVLYGLSLPLCATRRQLDRHAWRLLTAQVVAVTCFLLFPLRFSFERGEVGGAFGWLFEVLTTFDRPFNQAPSLHMALLVLLWVVYLRALPRAWRWPLHAAFALIGVSVLTTWQHHFIDVPTGLWLGWLCLWLFPDDLASPLKAARLARDPARRRLALTYGAGALVLALLAWGLGGTGLWLLWPAGALALVAGIYLGLDGTAFQKRVDGSLSVAARWLFGPYRVGAWLNSRAWTRRMAPADPVAPGVLLGRVPTRRELDRLGVAAVVDVSAELPCHAGGRPYWSIPMLDLVPPGVGPIERAASAVEAARQAGPVLVCCALGLSRGALAVAAWLLRSGSAISPDEALARLRGARPGVVLAPASQAALEDWWARRRSAEAGEAGAVTPPRIGSVAWPGGSPDGAGTRRTAPCDRHA
jgi:protein-tyrosine phosphatase